MPTVYDTPPKLWDMRTTRDVFWSPRWSHPQTEEDRKRYGPSHDCGTNSYVLLAVAEPQPRVEYLLLDGRPVLLVSVHSHGGDRAIRWDVDPSRVRDTLDYIANDPTYPDRPWKNPDGIEGWRAFAHFGLTLPSAPKYL